MYADDLKIYKNIDSPEDCILLQKDIDSLKLYRDKNKIKMNIAKCFHISFTRNKNKINYIYQFDNTPIAKCSSIRDLGVILDSTLSFRAHIEAIAEKAYKMLGFIIRISKPFNEIAIMKLLYNSFVRSHLEFASPVWSPHYQVHINRLQHIQDKFIRYLNIKTKSYCNNTNEASVLFKMDPLVKRRNLNDAMYIFKILNGIFNCSDLVGEIKINAPSRTTRQYDLFRLPRFNTIASRNGIITRCCDLYNKQLANIDIFNTPFSAYKQSVSKILLRNES